MRTRHHCRHSEICFGVYIVEFQQVFLIEEMKYMTLSHPEVFLVKGVLKICSKFTREHPYRSVISTMLRNNGCSPVNLLHIFRIPFTKITSGWLLLIIVKISPLNMFPNWFLIFGFLMLIAIFFNVFWI